MEAEGQGKRPPVPVLVEVAQGDIHAAIDFARAYIKDKQHAGKPGWRGGLVPDMVLRWGIEVEKDIAGTVIGKVAESAMCRLAGVRLDDVIRRGGDGGKDLLLPCGATQVKASRTGKHLVRVPAERADWFVFATWNGTATHVAIDGYISRPSLVRHEPKPSHRGNWMNYEVSSSSLRPIRSLLQIRTVGEVLQCRR